MMKSNLKKILFLLISLLFIFLSYSKNDIADLNIRLISVNQHSINAYEHKQNGEIKNSKQRIALKRSITIQKQSINKFQQIMIFISVVCLLFIISIFFIKEMHIIYKITISVMIIYFILFYGIGYRV